MYPPMLVRDLMTIGVATCPPETSIDDLARLVLENGCEEVIILEEGHALGVVGQAELVNAYAHQSVQSKAYMQYSRSGGVDSNPELSTNPISPVSIDITARQIMREGVVQIPPDIPVTAAVQIMLDHGVRTVFLMHHSNGIEYPAGFLSYWHILRHLAAYDSNDLRDLGNRATRQSPLDAFIQKRDAKRNNKP